MSGTVALSNLGGIANALYNSITANSTAITAISVGAIGGVTSFNSNVTFSNNILVGNGAVINSAASINTWYYSNNSLSVSAQETGPSGLFFKPDGTKFYICGTTGDDVTEYSMSSAWNITTATAVGVSINVGDSLPSGVFFKPDGAKMFVVGYTNDTVREFDLSTAWSVNTATFVSNSAVITTDATPFDLSFKSDGTKMYIVAYSTNYIQEYDLSSAWSVNTATLVANTYMPVTKTGTALQISSIVFNSSGNTMWVGNRTRDTVIEFKLNTAWSVNTATYVGESYVGFQELTSQGLWVEPSQNKAWILGDTTDAIYEYITNGQSFVANSSNYTFNGDGESQFLGDVYVRDRLHVVDDARFEDDVTIASALSVLGSVTFSTTTGALNLGTSQSTGTTIIGGTTQTGLIQIGRSTANQTISIANGATTSGNTKVVNIGTGGLSGSNTTISIGSSAGTGEITLNQQTTSAANLTIAAAADLVFASGAGIVANGSLGTTAQVLSSNGTSVYWATAAGSGTVTSVATGNGLTGGTITTTGTISVVANTGLVANATGVYVNATYISTISANNASFLGGTAAASYQLNSTLAANVATMAANSSTYSNSSVTNTFTVGTAAYFVSNGNVGIGTSSPAAKLDVNGGIVSRAIASEGGEISFNNPDNLAAGLVVDVSAADTGRIFNVRNNSQIQIGQLIGTGGIVTLYTEASERVRLAANGNVGIGTSTPGNKLAVIGTTGDVATFGGTGGSVSTTLYSANGDNRSQIVTYGPSSTGRYPGINIIHYTSNATGGDAGGFPVLEMYRQGGNNSVTFATPTGTVLSGLNTYGSNATSALSATRIEAISEAAFTTTATAAIRFLTTNAGTQAERMRISANGNVGIGTSSPNATLAVSGTANVSGNVVVSGTSATFANTITVSVNNTTGGGIILADDGDIVDLNDGYCSMRFSTGVKVYSGNRTGSARILLGSDGAITANGNITAYGNASDINLKENIVRIKNALDKVCKLGGYHFNYIGKTDKLVGVIAQEVQEVFPELVYKYNTENDDESIAVRYSHITAVLIEAIKEQQNQIEDLRSEVKTLKAAIAKEV